MKERTLSSVDIMRRLPHRHPFLLIDRVVEWGPEKATAIKNVTINEAFFVGHFPAEPIMPGVLIGEAMAQTTAFVGPESGEAGESIGQKAFMTGLDLKIKQPVRPGDQLVLTARLIKRLGKLMKFSAQASVDGEVVATAEINVALI